jgi:hypothetical protein
MWQSGQGVAIASAPCAFASRIWFPAILLAVDGFTNWIGKPQHMTRPR